MWLESICKDFYQKVDGVSLRKPSKINLKCPWKYGYLRKNHFTLSDKEVIDMDFFTLFLYFMYELYAYKPANKITEHSRKDLNLDPFIYNDFNKIFKEFYIDQGYWSEYNKDGRFINTTIVNKIDLSVPRYTPSFSNPYSLLLRWFILKNYDWVIIDESRLKTDDYNNDQLDKDKAYFKKWWKLFGVDMFSIEKHRSDNEKQFIISFKMFYDPDVMMQTKRFSSINKLIDSDRELYHDLLKLNLSEKDITDILSKNVKLMDDMREKQLFDTVMNIQMMSCLKK